MLLSTSLSKLRISELDLPFRQFTPYMLVQGHVPYAVDAARMAVSHVLLEMVSPLEHLVLLVPRADIACVNTVRMLYAMPEESVAPRVRLATPDFLTSPCFVQRALGVPVESLKVLELEPTL